MTLTETRFGGFRLLRLLGEGGMGTVYLASVEKARKGLRKGQEVAIKILHPHLARDEEVLRRFRREARLGRSIHHPRVMSIFDVGSAELEGEVRPFLVMERLHGRTLRAWLDEKGRFSDAEVARIGAQIAEGLAAIHDLGIVHRDVKPQNLFLDDEGRVKIGDLGLSRLLSPHSEISLPGTIVGSAAYSAPEQLEGEKVGPAADLYALGVTLFELAAGRNPFAARDVAATIHAQKVREAPPLCECAPDASWFLDRFVAALLDKEPDRRPAPASLVARTLSERERSEWWWEYSRGEGRAGERLGPRRQLRVRRSTRLWGREEECDQLTDQLRTAVVGRCGSVTVVEGEEGSGRSRLVDAAIEALGPDLRRSTLVVSRFLDLAAAEPYFALNQVLLRAFGLERLTREERRDALRDALRRHLPERGVLASAFAALVNGKEHDPELESLSPEAIPGLYAEAFRTLSVRSPLLLVLEEIQWADRGSLRVLERLTESIESHPLALVLTTQPQGFDRERPAAPFLERLTHGGRAVHLRLDRLDRRAIAGIVRDLGVAEAVRDRLVRALSTASEGNPAILFALVEDLQERRSFSELRAADISRLPLPTSIVEYLRRRLENLEPDARRFLEFASIFGTRFKLEPVVEGLGLDWVTATELAARLARKHRVIRAFERAYRFDHHLLREQVYRDAPPRQRRRDHLVVARRFAAEVEDPLEPARSCYEAAIHFLLAEAFDEALPFVVGGVRYLRLRSLHERARRMVEPVLRHFETGAVEGACLDPTVRFEFFVTVADLFGHLGRTGHESDALRSAFAAARETDDAARMAQAEVMLARFTSQRGLTLQALGHAEQARTWAKRARRPDLEAAALRAEAAALQTLGETEHEESLERADRLARAAGDELGRGHGLLLLAKLQLSRDRPERALRTLREALGIFASIGDERGRGRVFFHVARVFRELGDLRRALRSLGLARRVAERNSDRRLLARLDYLAGELALRRRRFTEARHLLDRAAAELGRGDDRTWEVYALMARALVESARRNAGRDLERALETAREARRLAHRLELPRLEAYAFAVLAFVHLAAGRAPFALAVVEKGLRFLEERPVGRKREAEMRFLHYRCLKRLGRRSEARAELDRARHLVLERAAEIERDVYRRAFLELDPFNVAVLSEAAKFLGKPARP